VELAASLEKEIAQGKALRKEFEAYKDEHKISGDLAALQEAVAGLQEKLDEKQEE
jgi:hypothetical protein